MTLVLLVVVVVVVVVVVEVVGMLGIKFDGRVVVGGWEGSTEGGVECVGSINDQHKIYIGEASIRTEHARKKEREAFRNF